ADDVERQILDGVETGVETMNLRREAPVPMLRHLDQVDPGVLPPILLDDLARPVGGTVIDDHPPKRRPCLSSHRLERQADVLLFVSRRRNQNVVQGSHGRRCQNAKRDSLSATYSTCSAVSSGNMGSERISFDPFNAWGKSAAV